MKHITICDRTIKQLTESRGFSLSFKEKIEVAKLLDKLNVDVIELSGINEKRVDPLLIKSVVTAVRNSAVSVPVKLDGSDVSDVVGALSESDNYRLLIEAPVSSVRMEYVYHKKADPMLEMIKGTLAECLKYTENVELFADDATRADRDFLYRLLKEVIAGGAKYVTLADSAGEMLPEEFRDFINDVQENVPEIENVIWGVSCFDELSMADECTIAAAFHGAHEIKASAFPVDIASLENVSKVIAGRGDTFGVYTGVYTNRIKNTIARIGRLCMSYDGNRVVSETAIEERTDDTTLYANDSKEEVMKACAILGYDLSAEDQDSVYNEFQRIAGKKESIGLKELDALVASSAMQVPPTYKLDGYIVNTGNKITSMVHMRLEKDGEILEGISLGDGPIDASFLAIEQITKRHFELDGFQIRAVTEGGSAAGEAIVKLRSNGKLYSGRGLSTDIIGASIRAYIIALNKIMYEEEPV